MSFCSLVQNGIEKQMVKEAGIGYRAIAAGKLRRYFDWHNFWDIGQNQAGFLAGIFFNPKRELNFFI